MNKRCVKTWTQRVIEPLIIKKHITLKEGRTEETRSVVGLGDLKLLPTFLHLCYFPSRNLKTT